MPSRRLNTARTASDKSRARRARAGSPGSAAPEQEGRERILQAAIRAFSEVGYAGTTTAGIARAAGVTQPLVHHHFGSKEGLWRAAMDRLFANIPRVAEFPPETSPQEAIAAVVEQFIRFVAARPEVTRVIAREGATSSPRLDYLLKRYLHEPFRAVVDLIRVAQGAGVVEPELRPELLLFMVLGAGSHLFDVAALAQKSLGIDTTAAWTSEAFVLLMRTILEQGIFRRG